MLLCLVPFAHSSSQLFYPCFCRNSLTSAVILPLRSSVGLLLECICNAAVKVQSRQASSSFNQQTYFRCSFRSSGNAISTRYTKKDFRSTKEHTCYTYLIGCHISFWLPICVFVSVVHPPAMALMHLQTPGQPLIVYREKFMIKVNVNKNKMENN